MEPNAEADSLKRVFGLPTLVIYGVGDILGAGIYAVIGKIAGLSGSLVWVSFLTAMIVAALTALSYANSAAEFRKAEESPLSSTEHFARIGSQSL
jgi:amino acid transporter